MSGPEDLSKLTNEQLQALLASGAPVQPTNAQTGQPLPDAQAQFYRQYGAAGGLDPQAQPGSPRMPLAQGAPEDLPAQDMYYVTPDGRVQHMPKSDVGGFGSGVMDRVRAFSRGIPVVGAGLDEADAATAALLAPALEPVLKHLPGYDPRQAVGGGKTFGDRYDQALTLQHLRDSTFDARHPGESVGLQGGGAIAGTLAGLKALAPISSALPAEAGLLPRMAAGGAEGAAQGGAQGYLAGDGGPGDESRLAKAMEGVLAGGAIGTGMPVAMKGLGSAWDATGAKVIDRGRSWQDAQLPAGPDVKRLSDLTGGQPGMPAALATGGDRDLAEILASIKAGSEMPKVRPSLMDRAYARVGRAAERQGQSPEDLARALEDLGPRAVIADTGQAMRDLTREAMNRPSGAEGIVRKNLDVRQSGVREGGDFTVRPSSSRIADAAREGIGGPSGTGMQTFDTLSKIQLEQAAPLYAELHAIGATDSPVLQGLSQRPSMKKAIAQAYRLAKEEGRNPEDLAIVSLDSPEDFVSSLTPEDQAVLQAQGAVLKRGGNAKPSQGPSLAKFIADGGGVIDDGGDLAAMGAADWHKGKPYQRSLIGKPTADMPGDLPGVAKPYKPAGNSADDWALRAWEAGYFPAWKERPTTRELYDALAEELRGKPRFARSMSDELTQRLDMKDQAEEVLYRGGAEPPPSPEDYTGRPPPAGETAYEAQPTAHTWDYVKRALDDQLAPYREGKKAWDEEGRAILGTLNSLRTELVRLNPVYGQALDAWSGPAAMKDALQAGRRAFLESGEGLERKFKEFSPGEREMYRLGAMEALRDKLGNGDVTFNAAQRAGLLKPAQLARFKELFPNEKAFQGFVKTLDQEAAMFGTRSQLYNVSTTAKQLAHGADEPPDLVSGAVEAGVNIKTGGIPALLKALKAMGTSKMSAGEAEGIAAITTGLDQSQLPQILARIREAGSSAATAEALKRYLATSGTAAGVNAATAPRN